MRRPSSGSDVPGDPPAGRAGAAFTEPATAPGEPCGGLFEPLSGGSAADAELGDRAWLRALLDAERALAVAGAGAGVVPAEAAEAIAKACEGADPDPAELGRRSTGAGNPVVPLVKELRAGLPAETARWVHHGATSQDAMDTAASLVAQRALGPILGDLAGAAAACARLAEAHRDTVMAARTLGQQALPTTFGLRAAGWLVALDEARAALAEVAATRLAAQLGGAAGTLASLGEAGPEVARRFAAELDLPEPTVPWHTARARVAELAGAAGVTLGVLGKIALDVTLLAQTELGEVTEAAEPGKGGSSTLPHKRNPITAVLISAAARRAPGLVATLHASMAQEHERATGAWHAEWEPLRELLRLLGGAAARGRELLDGLEIHPDRMRAGLEQTGGLLMAERVTARLTATIGKAEAHDLVQRLSHEAAESGRPLRELLLADPVAAELGEAEIGELLDPGGYLGSAGVLVDRALAAHREHTDG
jgi:3-carboxy-cis,cis-muconate cycloisomerase